nr:hypothetical protein L204_00286 [Cryptococcus depauperatus CBS 7855]
MNVLAEGSLGFDRHERAYRITPIQEPERSAAFEGAYLSRLALSPPLILQLDCWNSEGQLIIPYDELPFMVCHLDLETPEGRNTAMIETPEGEQVSVIYGTIVATPVEMKDQAGAAGVYFVFPDVSIRFVGNYRLKAALMRITGGKALHVCVTRPFEIVHVRDYTAPPVTLLTRHFDSQGIVRFGLQRHL